MSGADSALALYGEYDTNVPTEASARLLRGLENPDISVIVYAGSGHAIEDRLGLGDSLFREDALADIVDFIKASASRTRSLTTLVPPRPPISNR